MSKHETPVFIVITGAAGAGKTTLANIIGARLRDIGMLVSVADDNGQTIVAADILQGNMLVEPNSPVFITTSDRATTPTPSA